MSEAMRTLQALIIGIFIAVCASIILAFVVYEMSWCNAWTEPLRSKLPCEGFLDALDFAVAGLGYTYVAALGILVLLGLANRR